MLHGPAEHLKATGWRPCYLYHRNGVLEVYSKVGWFCFQSNLSSSTLLSGRLSGNLNSRAEGAFWIAIFQHHVPYSQVVGFVSVSGQPTAVRTAASNVV